MNRNNRLDIWSLRPWAMAKEIKEVKVERREEEKRQSWQKGQNHAHSGLSSFLLRFLLFLHSFAPPYRACRVRYSTARHSTTTCAFDFSACTCVDEKHNVHRFFLCASMYLHVYHFGIILFLLNQAHTTRLDSPR